MVGTEVEGCHTDARNRKLIYAQFLVKRLLHAAILVRNINAELGFYKELAC
jgi:hypothetical protein